MRVRIRRFRSVYPAAAVSGASGSAFGGGGYIGYVYNVGYARAMLQAALISA